MLLLIAIFSAGLLHGIGPDHLAAITAFGVAVGDDFHRVVWFAVRFAAAHAVVIAIAGVAGYFGRMLLPPAWDTACELGGGLLLVLVGVAALIGLATGKIKVHEHLHVHHQHPHQHLHLHMFSEKANGWSHQHQHRGSEPVQGGMAATLGVLFALGGTRSLIAVVPIAVAPTLVQTLLRIAVFVAGIILAMVAYAVLTQNLLERLAGRANRIGYAPAFIQASSYLLAGFCIVAGMITIRGRLQG